jgi:hypothetical protein
VSLVFFFPQFFGFWYTHGAIQSCQASVATNWSARIEVAMGDHNATLEGPQPWNCGIVGNLERVAVAFERRTPTKKFQHPLASCIALVLSHITVNRSARIMSTAAQSLPPGRIIIGKIGAEEVARHSCFDFARLFALEIRKSANLQDVCTLFPSPCYKWHAQVAVCRLPRTWNHGVWCQLTVRFGFWTLKVHRLLWVGVGGPL